MTAELGYVAEKDSYCGIGRSLPGARSRAMRDRPEPRRDMEVRRTAAEAVSLVENQERKFDEESLRW